MEAPAPPEYVDFTVVWVDDRPISDFTGITGSAREGDYLSLSRGGSSYLINLRQVSSVAIHPSVM